MRRAVVPLIFLGLVISLLVGLYRFGGRSVDPLDAARQAIARRDFAIALQELDAYLARRPHDREARLLAARTARRAGDGRFPEYLAAYRQAGGDAETAELEQVMSLAQGGDRDAVNRLMRMPPDHPAAVFVLEALAPGLMATAQPNRAVACVDRWLTFDLSPADRVQGLVWRGQALDMQGLAPEAAGDYRQVLAMDPNHGEARLRLAAFLIRDEPREALALYRRLDEDRPGRFDVQLGLAKCYRQLGDLSPAADLLGRLQADRPDDVAVLQEAGALALDRGRPAEAEPLLRRAVALAPDRRDPNAQLLRCLLELGHEAEADKQRQRVQQIDAEIERRIQALTSQP